MAKVNVLGIYREERFSPGKIREDAAVLDTTLAFLPDTKYRVASLQTDHLDDMTPRPELVLSMAQSGPVLDFLEHWQQKNVFVINTVQSVRNCYRKALIRRLQEAGIPIPLSRIVQINVAAQAVTPISGVGCWLKRGDVHAMQPADVVRIDTRQQLDPALGHFRSQGIQDILLQHHVEGKVIKFYGVGRDAFFSAYFVDSGRVVHKETAALRDLAVHAAEAVGLEIYGGDAVLTPEGSMILIDLNDWPSFSPCRPAAARAIAGYAERYRLSGSAFKVLG